MGKLKAKGAYFFSFSLQRRDQTDKQLSTCIYSATTENAGHSISWMEKVLSSFKAQKNYEILAFFKLHAQKVIMTTSLLKS